MSPENKRRLLALAKSFGMTPTTEIRLEHKKEFDKWRWWLLGCVEGDQPLPNTSSAGTVSEALDKVEHWFSEPRSPQ